MKKHIKFILLSLLAVFIFWYFGRNLEWDKVWASIKQARSGYVIAGTLVICFGYLLRAKRWQVLLDPITKSSLAELFATTTLGFTAVFLIGRAGEIVRPIWLPMRDKRVRPSAAVVTIFVERIFDFAALICFFSVNLLWFHTPNGKENELSEIRLIGAAMLGGVIFGFLLLYLFQRQSAWFIRLAEILLTPFPNRFRLFFINLMVQLAKALDVLRDWREIIVVTFWTVLLWLSIAFPTWFVLLAFDLPLGITDALFVMGWAAIGSIAPTPGGAAGAFHVATANGLVFLGTPYEKAMGVSFVMHIVYFAPAVIFGLYYFFKGDISLSGFREMIQSDFKPESSNSDAAAEGN